jgi:hypothetical protein
MDPAAAEHAAVEDEVLNASQEMSRLSFYQDEQEEEDERNPSDKERVPVAA